MTAMPSRRRWRVERRELMLGLYALGALNGAVAEASIIVSRQGVAEAAAGLFGVDAVVLMSCLIGLMLAAGASGGQASRRDLVAAAAFALIVVLPHRSAGWLALGVLGLYGLLGQRGDRALAAAGAVFLAVSLHEAWARLALAVLTPVLTQADAALTAWALSALGDGVRRTANVVTTPAGYDLVVVAACVSFNAVAQGLLACFAFTRAVRTGWRWTELRLWAVLAVLLLALNILRLVLCGYSLEIYEHLHDGAGRTVFGLVVLGVALAVATYGLRHDLRSSHPRR